MSEPGIPNVLAIIPARGGSKGIPRKNHLRLGGRTLLELAIDSAQASQRLTRTIVSTDDEELASVAQRAGGNVPFLRPAELATDTATTWSVTRHAVTWLCEHEGWQADVVVTLQPTTPFRLARHIDTAIDRLNATGADAVMTVREADYPPDWMMQLDQSGWLSYRNPAGASVGTRQGLPTAYQHNGVVYVARREVVMGSDGRPSEGVQGVPMPFEESINIDHPWQYELARVLWEKRGTR